MPQKLLRAVIEGMGDGVLVVDSAANVMGANGALRRMFGLPVDAPLAAAWPEEAYGPDRQPLDPAQHPIRRALQGNPCADLEVEFRPQGRDLSIRLSATPIQLEDGESGVVAVFRDVTRVRQLEKGLRTQHEAYAAKVSALMDHLSTGVLFADPDGRIQLVNRAFLKFFGFTSADELVGGTMIAERGTSVVKDKDAFRRLMAQRMRDGVMALADRLDFVDGRIFERDYVPVNVEGVVSGHFWCFRDVTERERARAQLAELSNRDELTALYNRRGFITLAEQWLRIASRTRRTPLLLFVDVNGMKPINDRLGHAQGDRVLRDTADLLRLTFRESDILARLGGDEFVVLAVDAQNEHSSLLCDRLQRNVKALNETQKRPYHVSLSVGVSAWDPAKPRTVEELLAEADARMYEAKRSRRASSASIRVASGM
ncbi:MAG TPA: diguanylate cyclase [Polyangiaceae bacterium]|jgi:diguanylate cyclase (GGDEF)-like protein/PAS domain S-box-containing protein|nr:diguanylate cyclase [Polyangiaceae bacterium]